ncbi:MAG: hypothetical protein LBT59_11980, partial [Clostridiales bacterium]|nr:hypothetical protein [Clostridiales bacterium]
GRSGMLRPLLQGVSARSRCQGRRVFFCGKSTRKKIFLLPLTFESSSKPSVIMIFIKAQHLASGANIHYISAKFGSIFSFSKLELLDRRS